MAVYCMKMFIFVVAICFASSDLKPQLKNAKNVISRDEKVLALHKACKIFMKNEFVTQVSSAVANITKEHVHKLDMSENQNRNMKEALRHMKELLEREKSKTRKLEASLQQEVRLRSPSAVNMHEAPLSCP